MGLIKGGTLFQLFWVPATVSAGLLLLFWAHGSFPRHALTFAAWFLLAVILQFTASTPVVWVLGLILQTALAVVLLLKYRFDQV